MAQTATQDDDILIISDDTSSHDDGEVFLGDSLDVATPTGETPVISTETDTSTPVEETAPSLGEGEVSAPQETDSSSQGIDLGLDSTSSDSISLKNNGVVSQGETETSTEETPITLKVTSSSPESEGGLDFSDISSSETATPVQDTDTQKASEENTFGDIASVSSEEENATDEASLNVILTGTITKLQKRQEVIASDTSAKETQVQDLKDQIVKLEEEVALHEAEIAALETEDDKIKKNITQLEKMKLGEEEVKEHNAKRVAKK